MAFKTLKRLFEKLLKTSVTAASIALLALFFATAPQDAHAEIQSGTPNTLPVPTVTGQGAFDCLGEFDWGCRILSFLFDEKDNTVLYHTAITQDGRTTGFTDVTADQ